MAGYYTLALRIGPGAVENAGAVLVSEGIESFELLARCCRGLGCGAGGECDAGGYAALYKNRVT